MRKKRKVIVSMLILACSLSCGCSDKNSEQKPVAGTEIPATESIAETEQEAKAELADGVYTADFDTDNAMFHVSEACDGKGTLTVENGAMTIHVSLGSKNIVNLYPGLAEDAKKDGAELLEPTTDSVTYSDGSTEEVYGFDIPVPALDEEFDLALIGTKEKWYDHKVIVSNPEPSEDTSTQKESSESLADGNYTVDLTFEGGSGKAEILSPATITVSGETMTATVQWNSPNYDYMIVNGEKYLPVNTEGDSVFEIPITAFDEPVPVIGDTVAMSKPHEVEYTITFHSDTRKAVE
ncbi:MAG: iron transporter [Lachnospiraceae bacterium]|nr:iron transporter [Lachnospiraceae bacterium]